MSKVMCSAAPCSAKPILRTLSKGFKHVRSCGGNRAVRRRYDG